MRYSMRGFFGVLILLLFSSNFSPIQDSPFILRRVKELSHIKVYINGGSYDLTEEWMELAKGEKIKIGAIKLVYDEERRRFYFVEVFEVEEQNVGRFIIQFNPARGLRPGAVKKGVVTHEERENEGKICPFCKKEIIDNEKVLDLEINGRKWVMVYNPFPIELKGHFLLIPEETIPWEDVQTKGMEEQTLTKEYIEDMIQLINNSENLILFFNGIGAGASQPHTHIQAMYHSEKFPVEEAFEKYAKNNTPLIEKNGVKIWLLPQEVWPATCIVFEGKDSSKVAEALSPLINEIQTAPKDKISYNLIFTRDRVYLFLRNPQNEVQEIGGKEVKLGGLEMSGMFIISDEKVKSSINENKLERLLINATKDSEILNLGRSLINYLQVNRAQAFPELASIKGLKSDEIEAVLNLMLFMSVDSTGKVADFLKECISTEDNLRLVGLLSLSLLAKDLNDVKEGINFIISQRLSSYRKDYVYQSRQYIDLIPGRESKSVLRCVLLKRFAFYSQNLNGFKKNFTLLSNWISKKRPIYSHELIEIWDEADEWCGVKREKREGRDSVVSHFLLTAGGFLIVGVGNIHIVDKLGAVVYLCHTFKTFFPGQRLGREIIARIFKRADQIAKELGMKIPLAYCYYRLTDPEWDKIYGSGFYGGFKETPVYKLLDPILGSQFGMDFYERLNKIPEKDTRELISKINRLTQADGGWYIPFDELIYKIDENWWDWFYRDRILSFYNGNIRKWEEFQKEHDESSLMKKIENEEILTVGKITEDLSK